MDQKDFNFGFMSRRPEKIEEEMLYDFPYVEIVPATAKGSVTKFRLLNGAAALLSLEQKDNKVAYFQNGVDAQRFFLANSTELPKNPADCKVNLDNSFNSKSLHQRICTGTGLVDTDTIHFKVETAEVQGFEGLQIVEFVDIKEEVLEVLDDQVNPNDIGVPGDVDEMPNV